MIWKVLDKQEEEEYRKFVDEDKAVIQFLKTAQLWHPVIRDELRRRLK